MKSIIAQITPNNELLLRYVSRPNCLPDKHLGDNRREKDNERLGANLEKLEAINKLLAHGCVEYLSKNTQQELLQPPITGLNKYTKEISYKEVTETGYYPACDLGRSIEYYQVTKEGVVKEKSNYSKLSAERRQYLDIIKKSQHCKRRERSWGKKQTKKTFTRNARKKILCAGAVVDKECAKESTYEVTTTIPGSGMDVFDCVARWSGWIINRQAQIIRRYEKKGWNIYWFFVWEHQKRGALHQHWCIGVDGHPNIAREIAKKIRDKWFELLIELSEKESIDLFKRKGILGTWRNKPQQWQSHILEVKKSVAAYFSKYCSKNYETSESNKRVRKIAEKRNFKDTNGDGKRRNFALYPSRYWGSGYRVKDGISKRTRTIRVIVANRKEGDMLASAIEEWTHCLSDESLRYEQDFTISASDTGFIYARGWTKRIWFDSNTFNLIEKAFDTYIGSGYNSKDAMAVYAEIVSSFVNPLF